MTQAMAECSDSTGMNLAFSLPSAQSTESSSTIAGLGGDGIGGDDFRPGEHDPPGDGVVSHQFFHFLPLHDDGVAGALFHADSASLAMVVVDLIPLFSVRADGHVRAEDVAVVAEVADPAVETALGFRERRSPGEPGLTSRKSAVAPRGRELALGSRLRCGNNRGSNLKNFTLADGHSVAPPLGIAAWKGSLFSPARRRRALPTSFPRKEASMKMAACFPEPMAWTTVRGWGMMSPPAKTLGSWSRRVSSTKTAPAVFFRFSGRTDKSGASPMAEST